MSAEESNRSAQAIARVNIGARVNILVWHGAAMLMFFLVWSVVSTMAGRGFLPSPLETAKAGIGMWRDGSLGAAMAQSLYCLLAGYAVAALVAIPCGVALGALPIAGVVAEPYIDALSSMPRIALLPLIIVFLGLGYKAKIFMVFIGAVMPILINTYAGILQSDPELVEMARSAGATGPAIFRSIVLPSALPYIMTGLRIGASLALINTVVAELYTAISGLGGLLSIYGNSFRMAPYFVIVVVLAVIGILLMYGIRLLERRVMRWRISTD